MDRVVQYQNKSQPLRPLAVNTMGWQHTFLPPVRHVLASPVFFDDEASPIVPASVPSGWGGQSPEIVQYSLVIGEEDSPVYPRQADPVVAATLAMVVTPDTPRRRQPVQDPTTIIVPAAFQGQAWVAAPDRSSGKVRPLPTDPWTIPPLLFSYSGDAWVSLPDAPKRARRQQPDNGYTIVPAAFVGKSWDEAPILPLRRKPLETPGDLGFSPFSLSLGWLQPEPLIGRQRAVSVAVSLWPVQQVPTQFVPNAWVVEWPGPQRKPVNAALQRFDDPVLGAYSSVVITYPDGWQTMAPTPRARRVVDAMQLQQLSPAAVTNWGWAGVSELPRRAKAARGDESTIITPRLFWGWVVSADVPAVIRARPRDAFTMGQTAAVTPYGWTVSVPTPTARRIPKGFADVQLGTLAAPSGWWVRADIAPRRAKTIASQSDVIQGEQRQAPTGADLVWGVEVPRQVKRPSTASVWPKEPLPEPAPLGDADLWGFVSYAFRTIIPAAPQVFPVVIRPAHRIGGTPTLLGQSTAPTLYGASTAPNATGGYGDATLTGASTAPNLLGASTDPDLTGEV